MHKAVWWVLALAALAYAGICGWLYARQRDLVYFPQFTQADSATTDFALRRNDGAVLRGWIVNPGRPRAIVYFGGNGERVEDNRALFERWLSDHTVYLVAYRGYGASDGAPSQQTILADALALVDRTQQQHPGEAIGAIGRSLGSGVASYVASLRRIDRLALVTPFDSLAAVAQGHYPWLPVRWLLRERYDSVRWLAGYHRPLLVVRAGRDQVVPPARTDHLVTSLPHPPQVLSLPDAGHNTLDEAAYGPALQAFFDGRPVRQASTSP